MSEIQNAKPLEQGAVDLTQPFDLAGAFLRKQEQLLASLNVTASFTSHPTTIGDASEADWTKMLREFLPARYGVGPVFAVDSRGRQSQQIDVAVYDRQYAFLFFEGPSGALFVPVESIYAVFEVKQEITKPLVEYSRKKIASVRALHRTSAGIKYAGGYYPPQDPAGKPILGGLLALRSGWTDMTGKAAVDTLQASDGDRGLDLGIALDSLAFDIAEDGSVAYSEPSTRLIYFVLRLFQRLQALGTALAVEVDSYEAHINGLAAGRF